MSLGTGSSKIFLFHLRPGKYKVLIRHLKGPGVGPEQSLWRTICNHGTIGENENFMVTSLMLNSTTPPPQGTSPFLLCQQTINIYISDSI